jgi:hypothetical protein
VSHLHSVRQLQQRPSNRVFGMEPAPFRRVPPSARALRLLISRAALPRSPDMAGPAIVFEDRMYAGEWRVEWYEDHELSEVAIFSGRNARERAITYAEVQYGDFKEISFDR